MNVAEKAADRIVERIIKGFYVQLNESYYSRIFINSRNFPDCYCASIVREKLKKKDIFLEVIPSMNGDIREGDLRIDLDETVRELEEEARSLLDS